MVDKSLEIARRTLGREVYVNNWALEKLFKVGEAIAQVRDAVCLDGEDAQLDSWRNLVKLATWMAGTTPAYDEEIVLAAFDEGATAMLEHLELMLVPILE